jgi:hypothetical protein
MHTVVLLCDENFNQDIEVRNFFIFVYEHCNCIVCVSEDH